VGAGFAGLTGIDRSGSHQSVGGRCDTSAMSTFLTPPHAEEEPAGAVREAAALLLAGHGGPHPNPEQVRAAADPAELFQGTATLILALVKIIAGPDGDPLDLVAPVLRKLRRTEPDLPADVLTTVGGALIAAALGESPTRWRLAGNLPREDGALPVPPQEAYAWAITGWLLVDLLDHSAGAGTAASLFSQL
jgi:hypothetical protein